MEKSKIKKLIDYGLAAIRKPVLRNMLIVIAVTILVKGIAFYKETLVASTFGLSQLLDTFIIAMLIPGFISNVFIGAYRNVFIPNYVSELKTGKDIRAFQSTGFLITLIISIIFILISILLTDVFLESFYTGHTPEY